MYWGIVFMELGLWLFSTNSSKGRSARVETQLFHPQQKHQNIFPTEVIHLAVQPSFWTNRHEIRAFVINKEPVMFSLYLKHYNEMDEFTGFGYAFVETRNDHQLC